MLLSLKILTLLDSALGLLLPSSSIPSLLSHPAYWHLSRLACHKYRSSSSVYSVCECFVRSLMDCSFELLKITESRLLLFGWSLLGLSFWALWLWDFLGLFLLRFCLLCLAKYISEAELTDTVSIWDVAVRSAELTICLEDVITWKTFLWLTLSLLKVVEITFGKHKISLVWIVFDWSSQDHGALLELSDVLTLDKTTLKLEFIQQIVPKIMLCKNSCISEDNQTVFGTCQCNIESPWIIEETDSWSFIAPNTRKKYEVLFSTLETIDGCHFNFFVKLRVELALLLHEVQDKGTLAFIRCNYSDLIWS